MKEKQIFTREDTKVMKGVAILLMLIHHLWAYPDRIAGGSLKYIFTIFGQSSITYVGLFGQICVSLFFFLGGYGIYISCKNKEFDIVGKVKGLYVSLWKVFLIFIPVAFIFFSDQIAYCKDELIWSRYDSFDWSECLNNFFGLSNTYNGEWWFFTSYLYAIISFPFLRKVCDKYAVSVNAALIVVFCIFVTNIAPVLSNLEVLGTLNNNYLYRAYICQSAPYISCFWAGMVAAKGDLLLRLQRTMAQHRVLNPIFDILIWFAVIYLRNSLLGTVMDMVYVPLLIVASLDLLNYVGIIKKLFLKLGAESTNMWLIHTFLCYYFYEAVRIIVAPRWAVLSLLLLVIVTYLISRCVTAFWKVVGWGWEKVRKIGGKR